MPDNPRTITKARVRVTIEIPLGDTWGGDCPLSQVYRQAERQVREMLEHRDSVLAAGRSLFAAQIVGDVEVTAITCKRER